MSQSTINVLTNQQKEKYTQLTVIIAYIQMILKLFYEKY